MAFTKVRLNHGTIAEYLNGDHGVEAVLDEKAEAVAAAARASAPVATGAYVSSIHVETDQTDRMVKRVVATVPYALAVEAETGTLARALDAAGGS